MNITVFHLSADVEFYFHVFAPSLWHFSTFFVNKKYMCEVSIWGAWSSFLKVWFLMRNHLKVVTEKLSQNIYLISYLVGFIFSVWLAYHANHTLEYYNDEEKLTIQCQFPAPLSRKSLSLFFCGPKNNKIANKNSFKAA